MAPRWYAVAVSPGKLSVAERSIRAEGFETWVPLVAELDAAKRRRDLPMFPGYVLTAWADGDDWGRIVRAYGVRHILPGPRLAPLPIRPRAIAAFMKAADERRIVLDPRPMLFAEGVELRILRGPFLNATGVCVWSRADRVALLMDLLGGQREVVVPSRDVAQA